MSTRHPYAEPGQPVAALRALAAAGPSLRPAAIALLTLECQLLDVVTWIAAVGRIGIGGESNPLAAAVYHAAGVDGVVVAKLVGAVVLALLAERLAGRWWALLPAAIGLLGALTNLAAIAR